jgi:hypothetical protein
MLDSRSTSSRSDIVARFRERTVGAPYIRILSQDERREIAPKYPEGDERFAWYGAFLADGTLCGVTDDYELFCENLAELPVQLHECSGYQ